MVDRISRLQDEILCHILSFVTTKEAVATSVLSKRWTHLWISVPNIDFTNIRVDSIVSNYKFNEFVYSVLASRDAAGSNVESFHLDIAYSDPHLAYDCGFPNIVRWIDLVVQRKLKHLRLHLDEGEYDDDDLDDDDLDEDVCWPKLPISIFTCKTLVSLDLYRFHVEGFSFSSIGFGFPLLKTLYLEDIEFSEDRDFVLLLSGCPNLEELELSYVFFAFDNDPLALQEFKSLSLPKLTRAVTSNCFWDFFPLEALSTSQSTGLDTLKLYTKDHEVGEVNQLQHLYSDIHIFHNLTYLWLQLKDSLDLVVQVLHHCPKLQYLKLYKEPICTIDPKKWEESEFVPQCLSSYLRTCTIVNMGGLQSELMFATFILKNARILQTMKIRTQRKQEQPGIERKLSTCPKASATCQLLVY